MRVQPKDMPDPEEENKKAHQSVVENAVFFFVTLAVIRAGKHCIEANGKMWGCGPAVYIKVGIGLQITLG